MKLHASVTAAGAVLVIAALLAGCTTQPPAYESQKTAEDQCRLFRGYLATQAYADVMSSCTRHLGEAYCRQCLDR